MKLFSFCVLIALAASALAGNGSYPVIKIRKNDLDKVYTVFFADTTQRQISVEVFSKAGQPILTERFQTNGLQKKYSLKELSLGTYRLVVRYDNQLMEEWITLKSVQQIMDESIYLQPDYPALHVHTQPYNRAPMNIFIYDTSEKLLDLYYWEPAKSAAQSRKIDMTKYDGFEVRVLIVQEGQDVVDQLVPLY